MADKMTPEKWHAYYLDLWSSADQAMYRRCIDVQRMTHDEARKAVSADREARLEQRIAEAHERVRSRTK